jgi:PRTRC genetic system protein B
MNESVVKSQALVVHQLKDHFSAVVHEILYDSQQRPVMGAGRVMSHEDQEALIEILTSRRSRELCFLPDNLLAFDYKSVLWWRYAGVADIGFPEGQIKVHLPPLVFCLSGGTLKVAAIQKNDRPSPSTWLFHSGLPNVGESGLWCSGGNRLPSEPTPDSINKVQPLFLESPFTHAGGSKLNDCTDVMDFWKDKRRKRPFPIRRMMAMKKTLGDWIKEVSK